MNTQTRWRTTWLKRGEWNILLFSALCALMVASPCAGASFAASSLAMSSLSSLSAPGTPAPYDAVLWWLQASTDGAARNVAARLATADAAVNVLDAPLATPLHSMEIALPQLAVSKDQSSQPAKAGFGPLWPATLVAGASALVIAPRYDATRRYVAHSLTAHEASYCAGTRTNSFPE